MSIIEEIDGRFRSLNSVPVPDIRLTRQEWEELRRLIADKIK